MEFPFISGSNVARSTKIDVERSINFYPEIQVKDAKNEAALIGCPGRTLFGTGPKAPFRGAVAARTTAATAGPNGDRCFYVAYDSLYELLIDGISTFLGQLRTWTGYVGMVYGGTQLLVVDGQFGYVFDLVANTFIEIDQINGTGFVGGTQCRYQDGYFAVCQPGSNFWNISGLDDATSWSGLDYAQKEGNADPIVGFINIHREFLFLGRTTSELWYDAGTVSFPWAPIPGIFLDQGCVSSWSIVKADQTAYWLGFDDNGQLICFELAGYTPRRVSTSAMEKLLKEKFGDPTQIIGYTYQDEGHTFIAYNSLTSDTTIVYDIATKEWHERKSFNEAGILSRDRNNFHVLCFNSHITFDFSNANIYTLSLDVYTDNGGALPKIRIGPHYSKDMKYIFYNSLEIDMETGVGLDGAVPGSLPIAILKVSNDGGKTWSSERYKSIGPIGAARTRVRWNNLGRARDRVFWFEVDDPVKVNLVACNIQASIGNT